MADTVKVEMLGAHPAAGKMRAKGEKVDVLSGEASMLTGIRHAKWVRRTAPRSSSGGDNNSDAGKKGSGGT